MAMGVKKNPYDDLKFDGGFDDVGELMEEKIPAERELQPVKEVELEEPVEEEIEDASQEGNGESIERAQMNSTGEGVKTVKEDKGAKVDNKRKAKKKREEKKEKAEVRHTLYFTPAEMDDVEFVAVQISVARGKICTATDVMHLAIDEFITKHKK